MIRRAIMVICVCAASGLLAGGVRSLQGEWKYDFGMREYGADKPFDPSSWHLELTFEWGLAQILWSPPAMRMPAKVRLSPGWAEDYGWLRLSWSRQWMGTSGRTYAADYYRLKVFVGLPLLVIMAYPAFVLARWLRRGRLRWERGACLACGYDLTGNVTGTCPECGCRVHAGSDLPYVMRVRRRLLAGCTAATATVLAVALFSMVHPTTLREHGSVKWKGMPFEPEELVYEGDPAPKRRYRLVGGWLTVERRRSTPMWVPGLQPASVPAEWSIWTNMKNHGGDPDSRDEDYEIDLWREPKDCSLASVVRYHSFANLIHDRYRCVNVLDLSLWTVAAALGIWPALELVRRKRQPPRPNITPAPIPV